MANLGQLRTRTRNLLLETTDNTHFTDSVLNGYLNEASEFSAVFIEYPRDLVAVQAQANIGSYSNPADNLVLRTAYFGDNSISGDIRPLKIISEETLKELYPSWLDNTASSQADRPQYLIQIDRLTIHVFPRPNATGGASGKKIWLNYNYVPASMTNDSDTPDLPLPYHSLLPFYAAHLCYIPLQKIDVSQHMYNSFMEKVNRLKSAVTKESKENLSLNWGTDEGLGDNYGSLGGIIPQ